MVFMYLSDRQLADRFGVSRATIWRWARNSDFPQPVQLSPSCTRWLLSDIEVWESRRPRKRARQASEADARIASLLGDNS
ncbi:MAG: helix-turn-helix transcriptional regulator [Burkholderiales bacterium]